MKRFLLTFTALLSLVILSFSQNEKLSGKVLNNKNEPVVGASIKFEGSNTGAISGVDGSFTLTLAIGKKYTLVISSVGYETKTIEDVEVIAGQANELQVLMVESAKNTLGGVTVTDNHFFCEERNIRCINTVSKKYKYSCFCYFCRSNKAFS